MSSYDYDQILLELKDTLSKFDIESIDCLSQAIIESKRIFLAGTGRSGFAVKSFALRLMHLGLNTYVVGETITPAITNTDLLIIGSGSGETACLVNYAREAKALRVRIGLITIFPDSTVGKLADYKVVINAPTSKVISNNDVVSIQPMGSLFEQSMMLLFDGMILGLMKKLNVSPDSMCARHANLE